MNSRFKDPNILQKVCQRLGVVCEVAEKGKRLAKELYGGVVEGVASLRIPGWKYPVVVQDDGTAKYDNFNGQWGEQSKLDAVTQGYARDLTVDSLRAKGYMVADEKVEQDGTIVLEMVGN